MTDNPGLSRRTLAKGAAWAAPAIAVAAAAPAMAASKGPIYFTGTACKLPGGSSDFKHGYVFEMIIENKIGPQPDDAWIEITNMYVNGGRQNFIGFAFVPLDPTDNTPLSYRGTGPSGCSCGACGTKPVRFCIADASKYRVFLYTDENGNSAASSVSVNCNIYDCKKTAACGTGVASSTSTPVPSSPPTQDNPSGASCPLNQNQVFPLPTAYAYPAV